MEKNEEEAKAPSKDELNLIYIDSLNYYLNHSWNQTYDRISSILLKHKIFETKYFNLFVNSGTKSKEIGTSSVLFNLQKLQKYVDNETKNELKFAISKTLFKSKEFAQSFLILKNILTDDINDSKSWYLMGKIYFEYEKIDEASKSFFYSLKLDKQNFRIYEKLGNVYFIKKMFKESFMFYLMSSYLLRKYEQEIYDSKILKLRMKIVSCQCMLKKSSLKSSLGAIENLTNQIPYQKKKFFWIKSHLIFKFLSLQYKNFDRDYIKYAFDQLKDSLLVKENTQMQRLIIFFASRLEEWSEVIKISDDLFEISFENENDIRLLYLLSKFKMNPDQLDLVSTELQKLIINEEDDSNFDHLFLMAQCDKYNRSIEKYKECLKLIKFQNDFSSIFYFLYGEKKLISDCRKGIANSLPIGKEKLNFLKLASDSNPDDFEMKKYFIDCFIEVYKDEKNMDYLRTIFSFSSQLKNEKISNEEKLNYWNIF
eukprot:gene10144-2563_t